MLGVRYRISEALPIMIRATATCVLMLLMLLSSPASAQGNTTDPLRLALDIYTNVNREAPPEAVALRLAALIELYRKRCLRVSDYQVFRSNPNIYDLKVKCSGSPLYGVSVASNGYSSVFGGNGMIAPLDRRDSLIYSFAATGDLDSDSSLTFEDALEDTVERIESNSQFDPIYLAATLAAVVASLFLGGFVWFRIWKNQARLGRHINVREFDGLSTEVKDRLMLDARRVSDRVFKHKSGVYIARGKRGHRRLFSTYVTAVMYRKYGWRILEAGLPKGALAMDEVEGDDLDTDSAPIDQRS